MIARLHSGCGIVAGRQRQPGRRQRTSKESECPFDFGGDVTQATKGGTVGCDWVCRRSIGREPDKNGLMFGAGQDLFDSERGHPGDRTRKQACLKEGRKWATASTMS
jgi:hypothetical protein